MTDDELTAAAGRRQRAKVVPFNYDHPYGMYTSGGCEFDEQKNHDDCELLADAYLGANKPDDGEMATPDWMAEQLGLPFLGAWDEVLVTASLRNDRGRIWPFLRGKKHARIPADEMTKGRFRLIAAAMGVSLAEGGAG